MLARKNGKSALFINLICLFSFLALLPFAQAEAQAQGCLAEPTAVGSDGRVYDRRLHGGRDLGDDPLSGGHCEGLAQSCMSFGVSSASCTMQRGCMWDSFHGTCDGIETPCDQFANRISCSFQRGCLWVIERGGQTPADM